MAKTKTTTKAKRPPRITFNFGANVKPRASGKGKKAAAGSYGS